MKDNILKSQDIVSVIISAYNAEKTIAATLQSLQDQDIEKRLYEVIVVDDGSRDATREIIESFIEKGKMSLSYFFQKNAGVGMARNLGVSKSSGRVLAFTDADCICDSDWIGTIYRKIYVEKVAFISGYTYSNDTVIFPWKMAPVGQSGITANLAIDFTLVDGTLFHSGFRGMLGDDTDFVLNMEDKGIPLTSISEMRVLHPPNILSFERTIIRSRGRQNEVGLYKKHGKRVLGSFSSIFMPIIFSRISPFFLFLIGVLSAGMFLENLYGARVLLSVIFCACALFLIYGYRFLVIYNPDNRPISFGDRAKTLLYLILIAPLFLYYRCIGMIKFHFFML